MHNMKFGFAVLAFASGFIVNAATWTTGTWDWTIQPVDRHVNLALTPGCEITVTGNDGITAGDVNILTDVETTRNRTINHYACVEQTYGVGNGASIAYTFSGPADLTKVTVFSKWGDNGRIGFTFTSVEVLVDGVWMALPNSNLDVFGQDPQGDNKGNGRGDFGDGETVFASGVTGIRLNFGKVDNNGIGVNEIEIVGAFCNPIGGTEQTWDVDIWEPGSPRLDPSRELNSNTNPSWFQMPSVFGVSDTPNALAEPGVVLNLTPGDITYRDGGYEATAAYLTNGVFVTGANSQQSCWLGNGAELEFLFPEPKEIGRLRIYTAWNDANRDGFQMKGILYKLEGDSEYRMLPGFTGGYYGMSYWGTECNTGRLRVDVESDDGAPLIENAVALKLVFGEMDSGGTGFVEVQSLYSTTAEWTVSDWTGTLDRTSLTDNLLRKAGTTLTVSNNPALEGPEWWDDSAIVALNDGHLDSDASNSSNSDKHMLAITSNAVFQCEFRNPCNISSLGFWTKWDAGRDGQEIAGISAKFEGSDEFVPVNSLPRMHAGYTANDSTGHMHFELNPKEGPWLLENVTALRIQFGHQENCWTGYQEIEVFGEPSSRGTIIIFR